MPDYTEDELLPEWVEYYLSRDWPLLPLYGTEFGRCACFRGSQCKSQGKHPRNGNGSKGATTDRRQLRRWLYQWPEANLGIATGGASDLVIIDVDPRHDGDISLDLLEAEHGHFPRTFSVRTGGGGWHFYFSCKDIEPRIHNSAGCLGPGLDVRADGGYVVAPPSETPSGVYSVETDASVANIPTWLVDLLQAPKSSARNLGVRTPRNHGGGHWIGTPPQTMDEAIVRMLQAPDGSRNHILNATAYWAGRRIATGVLDLGEVIDRLVPAAELAGLDADEVERTLWSGLNAGMGDE
jgi:hypothetical protein